MQLTESLQIGSVTESSQNCLPQGHLVRRQSVCTRKGSQRGFDFVVIKFDRFLPKRPESNI